ncbi:MAG: DNA-deoxyinosine glycosylase, partial [Slackia sp.]|nr:DNA-deoxyinosine glycosylase [Slackia sp.]
MSDHVIHTIEPVFDARSRVLVLGSIPSPKSREEGFFYGHPQNRFWRVLAEVFDEPAPRSIDEKRDLLLRRHIALWDVVASCDIEGASDASIKNAEANDLARIFEAADIRAAFATGTKAGQLYKRLCEKRYGMACTVLPSTSPANAKASLDSLVQIYKEALSEHLEPFAAPVLDVARVGALEQEIAESGTPLAELMDRAGRTLAWTTEKLAERKNAQGDTSPRTAKAADAMEEAIGVDAHTAGGTQTKAANRISPDGTEKADAKNKPAQAKPRTMKRCVVLCGNGNNGGDGWVAATELAASGYDTTVVSAVAPDAIEAQPARDAAMHSFEKLCGAKHARVIVGPDAECVGRTLDGADVVIDAMLGTGFSGTGVRAPFDAWINACNKQRERGAIVVAADVPSG